MTARVRGVIQEFGRLSEDEQREAAAEILRLAQQLDFPSLTDDELMLAAESLFSELDRAEAAHEEPTSG